MTPSNDRELRKCMGNLIEAVYGDGASMQAVIDWAGCVQQRAHTLQYREPPEPAHVCYEENGDE